MAILKDIAAEAGVSIMTVSNVINGNHDKVSKKTVVRIQELIEKHHYVPNLSARSLTSKSSKIIGILLSSENSSGNYFTDPYLSELFGEIETLVRNKGYFVIIRTIPDIHNVSTFLQNWNADGAIFITHQEEATMNTIIEHSKCPIVFIDSYNKTNPSALMVGVDDYKGGYIATKHLIHNGHKRIAFAGSYSENNSIIAKRFQGYQAALKEADIPYTDDLLITTFTNYEDGIRIGRDIANKKYDITAVFASADLLAIGIMEGAHINGYVVPNDLSIIGFDNLQLCNFVTPKLTTVSQNVKHKAESTVDLLMAVIDGEPLQNRMITLDVQLELRQTVQVISSL